MILTAHGTMTITMDFLHHCRTTTSYPVPKNPCIHTIPMWCTLLPNWVMHSIWKSFCTYIDDNHRAETINQRPCWYNYMLSYHRYNESEPSCPAHDVIAAYFPHTTTWGMVKVWSPSNGVSTFVSSFRLSIDNCFWNDLKISCSQNMTQKTSRTWSKIMSNAIPVRIKLTISWKGLKNMILIVIKAGRSFHKFSNWR